jgi:sRNA-binding regulator protein Hfq
MPQKKGKVGPKKKLPTGDSYLEKQSRLKIPMVFELYDGVTIHCLVDKILKYEVFLKVGEEMRKVEKLTIKYFYKEGYAQRVKENIEVDEDVKESGIKPIKKRLERYHVDDKELEEARKDKIRVVVTTNEGDMISGLIDWFSKYEIKLMVGDGATVVVMRHAVYNFVRLD